MMLKKVDEEEKVTQIVCTHDGNQEKWFLTEDGLYKRRTRFGKSIAFPLVPRYTMHVN